MHCALVVYMNGTDFYTLQTPENTMAGTQQTSPSPYSYTQKPMDSEVTNSQNDFN